MMPPGRSTWSAPSGLEALNHPIFTPRPLAWAETGRPFGAFMVVFMKWHHIGPESGPALYANTGGKVDPWEESTAKKEFFFFGNKPTDLAENKGSR